MAVIWGLDLHDMKWSAFSNSYMWKNTDYHMRRTRFIIYQCAMILCVVSESLGTAALSDYVDQQAFMEAQFPASYVHNNNFIAIASFNIFAGIFVATIFGAAFFFDLFWPERHESPAVKMAWRICSVLACVLTLACALTYTIIVATKSAYVTGSDEQTAERELAMYGGSPLKYRENGRAIASVVFLWPGMVFTFVSTYLLWHSIAHIDAHGPKSMHARTRDGISKPVTEKPVDNGSLADSTADGAGLPQPGHTYAKPEGFHDCNADANHSVV
ncbi:hypothetical protein HBI56_192200 [Parastagonospora nodorum]|nr:hypothetical protein HBH53_232740 [Parastagonospora nodorum]KAH4181319.1 hypothetical protein HBH42_239670 [Parastagonospora nodorum]KAH4219397.1 hypothetical protein HBI06_186530 [Parastagonospora nodorum]KAH4235942.1 hypothetical protein HBI05_138970 [Parastagonospora nodorum]KAH4250638.1 hypothetical protein HBI03_237530 [Parastagonospora nodorum]